MVFNAAKDLVYTISGGGNSISSGGYRISKILNGKSKKKGKQSQNGGEGEGGGRGYSSMFKEDSGIPIGLLLLQRLHHYDREDNHDDVMKAAAVATADEENKNKNKKLVYASIMAETNDDDDDRDRDGIELVIMPSAAPSTCENPIEISSNEIDDELYDTLVKSVSEPIHNSFTVNAATHLRRANATKKQNQTFGKHRDIEKVFQKRKTRSKRHH